MGVPKLLLPHRGGTVLSCLIGALREGGVSRIVLVAAPGDQALQTWGEEAGVLVALNPDPERGMLSSILAGISAAGGAAKLAQDGEALAVCPADLPALRPSTVAAVLRSRAPLAVPSYQGRRGHPLVIAPELIPEIESLNLDTGLRELLDRHPDRLLIVEVDDPGAVRDVDTPDDYRSLVDGEP
jgi:molybdenum cofactor cytidylyltransferase